MKRFNGKYDELDALEEWNNESDNYAFIRSSPTNRRAFWFRTIGGIIGALLAIKLFAGCSHLTVAPKPVAATEIAFDANVQNAGVIDCDKRGCLVTTGWMGRYRAMEKEFSSSSPSDASIKVEGANYRVPFDVSNKYAELRAAERGP